MPKKSASTHAMGRSAGTVLVALALVGGGYVGCGSATLRPEPGEHLGGGSTTNTRLLGERAYSQPLQNLDASRGIGFAAGNSFFTTPWTPAGMETSDPRDGLGPTFNATSCSGCHVKDGRGRPPLEPSEPMLSMLVRLSIPGVDAHGGPLGEPSYGGQLNPRGIGYISPTLDVTGEGTPSVTYVEVPGKFGDGTAYSLRAPTIVIADLAFGPFVPGTMFSARVAPAMIGLGLLESIPDAQLLAMADPNDADGDGISGRVNRVWDVERGTMAIGRFGWKAGKASLRDQSGAAFRADIGITSSRFPDEECPGPQLDCAAAPRGGTPEIEDRFLEQVELYARALAVPVRPGYDDPVVLQGRELFRGIGCIGCHEERFVTRSDTEIPELANQTIRPFTDLLLHDMGEGLADHRPEFEATGTEWRTPPLWGLGRTEDVSGHTLFLHDGRARGAAEAILWHGGEAEASKEAFRTSSRADRDALVQYLESL